MPHVLVYPQSDESIPLLKVTVQSLCRVYTHLVHKNYTWIVLSGSKSITTPNRRRGFTTTSEGLPDVTQQYRQWMRQNYLTYLERLLELLHHRNEDMQVIMSFNIVCLINFECIINNRLHTIINNRLHTIINNRLHTKVEIYTYH